MALTSTTGTNYVLNEHEDVDQCDTYAIPSEIMPCYSYPTSLVNQNEIMLTSSSGTTYVSNELQDADQYGSFTIPSKIMPSYSYPESLVNQNEIPVDLLR